MDTAEKKTKDSQETKVKKVDKVKISKKKSKKNQWVSEWMTGMKTYHHSKQVIIYI